MVLAPLVSVVLEEQAEPTAEVAEVAVPPLVETADAVETVEAGFAESPLSSNSPRNTSRPVPQSRTRALSNYSA